MIHMIQFAASVVLTLTIATVLCIPVPATGGEQSPHVQFLEESTITVQEGAGTVRLLFTFTNLPTGAIVPDIALQVDSGHTPDSRLTGIAAAASGSACKAGDDFVFPSTVQNGQTATGQDGSKYTTAMAGFDVTICDDDAVEAWQEEFVIKLVNATGYHVHPVVSRTQVTITIEDDDIAPADVTATPAALWGNPTINLTWPLPSDGVPYSYTLAFKKATSDTWLDVERMAGSHGEARIADALEAGVSYDVRISESFGAKPVDSSPVRVTTWTVPGKPTGVSVRAGANELAASWSAPTATGGSGATITGYQVRWRTGSGPWKNSSDSAPASPGLTGPSARAITGTGYRIPGLTNPFDYEVQVRALNGIDPGSEWSDSATAARPVTEPEPLPEPSPLNLTGTNGDNDLTGGSGNDLISGKRGNDVLRGKQGNDKLYGQDGNDKLHGGAGNDELHGGAGDDELDGGSGKDVLRGKQGNDVLRGKRGNDVLRGGLGDDALYGGAGNDTLYGGDGDDSYTGGPGADRFAFFFGETGDKVITDFGDGDDLIVLKTEADPWPSVADIIAGAVAQGDRHLVYTLSEGLTVETDTPLRTEHFLVK